MTNSTATIPVVNMVRFYLGYNYSDMTIANNSQWGIVSMAYNPLGHGLIVGSPICAAIGKQYGKSAVQVALRWVLQRGLAFATESTQSEHLKADIDIFDFALSPHDMAELDSVSTAH